MSHFDVEIGVEIDARLDEMLVELEGSWLMTLVGLMVGRDDGIKVELTGCWLRSWLDVEFEGIKIYSRGRRGDRNQAKCSILIPDRDDSSVHEIWAANILPHINTKVIITGQTHPYSQLSTYLPRHD